jgi:hypothetical protein
MDPDARTLRRITIKDATVAESTLSSLELLFYELGY